MTMQPLKLTLLTTATTLLCGCVSLAPDYQRPTAAVPAAWPDVAASAASTAAASTTASAAQTDWHTFFTDARLRRVIATALDHNQDLRVAALNVEKAQQQFGVQRAALLPSINANAGQTTQRIPRTTSTTGRAYIARQDSVTLGFSAYELDFFGRVRSLRDQALEQYFATEEAQRSAQISLVSEVATAYLTLSADQDRLALAHDTLSSQQKSDELTRKRFDLGVASELDVQQAQTLLQTARVDVARYTSVIAADRNALAVLIGSAQAADLLPPAPAPGQTALVSVTVLGELPVGLPSEVLQQRPDVRQVERQLRAANANIGAARAAFFPSITLTALGGTASTSLSDLFTGASRTWSFIPQVSVPIFNAGRNQANLRIAEIERDIGVAQYEKAVQNAFREVADALAQRATLGDQLSAQQALVRAASRASELSDARYRRGVDDYLAVLDAQRQLYSAQQGLIGTRLAQQTNLVTLYKALGGGLSAPARPPSP